MRSTLQPTAFSTLRAQRWKAPERGGGPGGATRMSIASTDVAGVLGEQAPGFLVEALARLRIEPALVPGLAGGRGLDLVEHQALAFQRLLQVDVGPGDVVALLARS